MKILEKIKELLKNPMWFAIILFINTILLVMSISIIKEHKIIGIIFSTICYVNWGLLVLFLQDR
jgi:hypothetical protein